MHGVRKPWRFVLLSPSFAAVDTQLYIFVGDRASSRRATAFCRFLSPFIFILYPESSPDFMANAPSSRANEAGGARASTGLDGGSKTE